MAFRVRVQPAYWEKFFLPDIGIEVPWWPLTKLQKDPRFLPPRVNDDGSRDFVAMLDGRELQALHERFKPPRVSDVLYELERVLALAGPDWSFFVNVSEWEENGLN
jgi:hypothetical protein